MTEINKINHKRPSIRDLQIDRANQGGGRRMGAEAHRARTGRAQQSEGHHAHKRGFGFGWWMLAVVLLISASVISLPIIFSDTTINIKPVVTKAVFTDAVFNAFKANEGNGNDDILTYLVVEWDAQESKELEPTGREKVKEKASGIITVYNAYTTKRQRLIKNTRFETGDGHVYRVRESIMVPGKTGSTPGTLDVRVYADEAGEDYNIKSGNLTLPGLKSLKSMYTDIYAKIKTPITGGFNGERAVVSEENKVKTSKILREKIKATVASEVQNRIPEDARYFESGLTIDFADTSESEEGGKVVVSESASVKVVVFNKKNFAQTMAQGVTGNPAKGYPVIQDVSKLSVVLDKSSKETIDGESNKLIVNGDADFVWNFNHDDLIKDLAGKDREALKTVLTGYPTIKTAEAIIRPFWRSTFPKNEHDFTIKVITK